MDYTYTDSVVNFIKAMDEGTRTEIIKCVEASKEQPWVRSTADYRLQEAMWGHEFHAYESDAEEMVMTNLGELYRVADGYHFQRVVDAMEDKDYPDWFEIDKRARVAVAHHAIDVYMKGNSNQPVKALFSQPRVDFFRNPDNNDCVDCYVNRQPIGYLYKTADEFWDMEVTAPDWDFVIPAQATLEDAMDKFADAIRTNRVSMKEID